MQLERISATRMAAAKCVAVALVALAVGIGCTREAPRGDLVSRSLETLRQSSADARAVGDEVWEVVICRIPEAYDSDLYDMTGVRLEHSADRIVEQIEPVSDYFRRWSNGRYRIEFRASERDVTPSFGGARSCVETAMAQSSRDVAGILVVADAQHREDRSGGWGRDGEPCATTCAPKASVRIVYLGAADFVTEAMTGSGVLLDLVEHEIGHALGWPHSMRRSDYDSPIDVMSDSSAPRRAFESRVHGPGTLAVNRYLAQWMDASPIPVDADRASSIQLPNEMWAFVALTPFSALTVEIVAAVGDNDHLERSGVAVHLVEWGPDVCEDPQQVVGVASLVCGGSLRSQRSIAPESSQDGLLVGGDEVEAGGVVIAVDSIARRYGRVTASIRFRPA